MATRKKLYYIGERSNPQFQKPYYVNYGFLSKAEATRKEKCIYGSMHLDAYETAEDAQLAINKLKDDGFRIH
jgi:hypothetical protein